ncbi:hypothetical protein FQZ97_621490 [compost metagenome]
MALPFTGAMTATGHTMAVYEIPKNSFANFAFENLEVAAYKSLLTVAEAGGSGAAPGKSCRGKSDGGMAR